MKRHDIRLMRESLGKTRIVHHKDYQGLMSRYQKQQRRVALRNVLILVAAITLAGLTVYGIFRLRASIEKAKQIENSRVSSFTEQPVTHPVGDLR